MAHNDMLVRFQCPNCSRRLNTPATARGQTCRCPRCTTRMIVPTQSRALAVPPPLVVYPAPAPIPTKRPKPILPAKRPQPTVPFKIGFPKAVGSVETTVSQGTANSVIKTVVGGFLVAVGVVLAVLLGVRRPPSA